MYEGLIRAVCRKRPSPIPILRLPDQWFSARSPTPTDRFATCIAWGSVTGLCGDWAGEELEVVAVGVVDVEASSAVVVVELARALVGRVGAVLEVGGADAVEDRVEGLVVDGEGEVVGVELLDRREVDGDVLDANDGEVRGGAA